MKKFIVVTTINPKSQSIKEFEKMDWHIVIVGDKKSHTIASTNNITFLSIDDQHRLGYKIVNDCPYNHYARKNIGYLYAIQNGAEVIYDADDDNYPKDNWVLPVFECDLSVEARSNFVNIYYYFSNENIWPRGYPLDEINADKPVKFNERSNANIGVWQGLVDEEPDVDAIYRLVLNQKINFLDKPSVYLKEGTYCPFNSQNTFWSKKAFQYLYLPATTSFRFTDILRGYLAQSLIWNDNLYLGFMKANVYQKRNYHDLMKDFMDEVEVYLNVKRVVDIIESINYSENVFNNLLLVYQELCKANIVKSDEMTLLKSWISDFRSLNE